MNRRDFIAAAATMAVPVTLNGFGLRAFTQNSALVQSLAQAGAAYSDRILVMVYLNGGNDGLNTVIPLEYYSAYNNLRSNIAIPEKSVLPLAGSPETGLHPAMTGLQQLHAEGKLAIVHSVSYPNPTFSHVRSSDIWMTGVDSDQYATSGWAGRYLDNRFPGYPEQYPSSEMEDPLAIQIGYVGSTSLLGNKQSMGISLVSPDEFYQLVGQESFMPATDLPCCDSGDLIKAIRQQQVLAIEYSSEIRKAASLGKNLAAYPEGENELAQQLKIVARLIQGGLKTKIYYVEMGGFDTHAAQVTSSSTTEGTHAVLLKNLSSAISAFQKDLQMSNLEDRVMGMTFSDFGRRASSNASKGTDHGIAAPMFLFGTGLKRQQVGTNPDLIKDLVPPSETGLNNQDLKMQIDFRRVYNDLLTDWFGTQQSKSDQLLFKNFKTTSLFSDLVQTIGSGNWQDRSIWSTGRPPGLKDSVQINGGHTVKVQADAAVKEVFVSSGGELEFAGNYTVSTSK
ncbi:DUF1501 domain-containing protein [Dyadobacter chenhuakuii]|uniref:DUF1501 domain-containing protein n=1 Tax=Dyadobacter chenhuakuii TaxID=2909339 RepID=A0A9X1QIJ4_9BACT|nr:DUF1501 domain-containing protein [Dyadobacter chenhuakuii]MCF2501479.1 DUF1501 domain-containing protein [Dyadobacter chenhuakuii]